MDNLTADGDRLLGEPIEDEHDWTYHFSRQLGISRMPEASGLHDTLMVILRQLDEAVNTWPPLHDARTCRDVARIATKDLSPIETYATLLSGPGHWRDKKVEAGRIAKLGDQLQPILENVIAAELARVLAKWIEWDVPRLKARWRQAVDARAAALAREDAASRGPTSARRRSGNKFVQEFVPPGRT